MEHVSGFTLRARILVAVTVALIFYAHIFFALSMHLYFRGDSEEDKGNNVDLALLHQRLSEDLRGNSSFVQNKTIYGAIIMTDYSEKHQVSSKKKRLRCFRAFRAKYCRRDKNAELSAERSRSSREMIAQLPFPVIHWPPVFSKSCPYVPKQHQSERGLLYAHLQIWLDFVYFDHDVRIKGIEKKVNGTYENEYSGYVNGTFMASENGTLYKNGSPYPDENVLVVFEDDSEIAVLDLHDSLRIEFTKMSTDLLFLGWCRGYFAKNIPLCTHAYALTMEGARKAIKHIEPCGGALDEQFVTMVRNKWITYRQAFSTSYKGKDNAWYSNNSDNTFGIFHQKSLGSFNGH